jgi:hypothetical protein
MRLELCQLYTMFPVPRVPPGSVCLAPPPGFVISPGGSTTDGDTQVRVG